METVQANGLASWVVGLVGTQSERFRKVTLTAADLNRLTVIESGHSFDGDGRLLRLWEGRVIETKKGVVRNALRALLKAKQERGPDFLRLANAFSALYPKGSEEKRLLDAMLLAVSRWVCR